MGYVRLGPSRHHGRRNQQTLLLPLFYTIIHPKPRIPIPRNVPHVRLRRPPLTQRGPIIIIITVITNPQTPSRPRLSTRRSQHGRHLSRHPQHLRHYTAVPRDVRLHVRLFAIGAGSEPGVGGGVGGGVGVDGQRVERDGGLLGYWGGVSIGRGGVELQDEEVVDRRCGGCLEIRD